MVLVLVLVLVLMLVLVLALVLLLLLLVDAVAGGSAFAIHVPTLYVPTLFTADGMMNSAFEITFSKNFLLFQTNY